MSSLASVASLMANIMLRIDVLRAAGHTEATNVDLARLAGHLASITARYRQPDALKVLTSPPIFDCLYDYCTARTLCCLARTCVAARQAVENYLRHALNVNKLLVRFFGSLDGARAFRNLQARYEFVVSGSQALQLLDRTVYPKSDLDIYVFPLDGEAVGQWLIEQAGYEFLAVYSNEGKTFHQAVTALRRILDNSEPLESGDPDDIYSAPSVRGVLRFAKRTAGSDWSVPLAQDRARLEVQVIVSQTAPIHSVISFHATMSMNFITWDRVYSLYPRATLEERRALVTFDKGVRFEEAMLKYTSRGYRIETMLFKEDTTAGAFALGPRWVGDERCWVVKLDTTGITPPVYPLDPEVNSWRLAYANNRREKDFESCTVHAESLRSIVFRYRYAVTAEFFVYLMPFIIRQGTAEAMRFQVGVADVEPGTSVEYGAPKPAGYTYWDSHLSRFKKSFTQTLAKKQLPDSVMYTESEIELLQEGVW